MTAERNAKIAASCNFMSIQLFKSPVCAASDKSSPRDADQLYQWPHNAAEVKIQFAVSTPSSDDSTKEQLMPANWDRVRIAEVLPTLSRQLCRQLCSARNKGHCDFHSSELGCKRRTSSDQPATAMQGTAAMSFIAALLVTLTAVSAHLPFDQDVVDYHTGDGHHHPHFPFPDPGCPDSCKGERGSRGDGGASGNQGMQGPRGYPGVVPWSAWKGHVRIGEEGERGDDGVNGARGDRGRTGPQGAPGTDGSRGNNGAAGQKGEPGDQGSAGRRGDGGVQGDTGPPGVTGAVGPKGFEGARGANGEQGFTGPKGVAGAKGAPGLPGQPGDNGAAGVPGSKGDMGDEGEPGDSGSSGEKVTNN